MSNTVEFEANTEQEAVQKACKAVKLSEQELDYTVMDEGSSGLLGLGARPVRIRVRVPEGMSPVEEPTATGVVGPAPEKAARALEVAQGLAERMGLEAQIVVRDEEDQIVIVVDEVEGGTSVADMLGRSRPPAIPSFQFLLNKIVNRFPEDRKHIIVEVPSVPRKERKKRERQSPREDRPRRQPPEPDPDLDPTLVQIAKDLAEKSERLGKVITVHPMKASDRRAFHQTIMTVDGVRTVSEGEGLYRRMHIVPASLSPNAGKKRRRRRRRRRPEDGDQDQQREPSGDGDEAQT